MAELVETLESTKVNELGALFEEDGFCVFENLLDPSVVNGWTEFSLQSFSDLREKIDRCGEHLGIGIKNGFKEIVQRHPLRYEMAYGANSPMFDGILQCVPLMSLVRRILRTDEVIVANRSFVISEPGAETQGWHSDGPHVSVSEYLPCHVLNVFFPLVDINETNGPTEFRPGSQKYTNNLAKGLLLSIAKKRSKPTCAPKLTVGSALLFDYRVLHRGGANSSSDPRPVLVFTFAQKWYKDNLNFPSKSIFCIMEMQQQTSTVDNDADEENIIVHR